MHIRTPPGPNDQGETLIELIIAVAIMGIAVVAIVGGIATSIMMSDIHRKQATAGSCVRNYAEAVAAYVAAKSAASTPNFAPNATPDYRSAIVGFIVPATGQLPCDVNSDDASPHPARFVATMTTPVLCWDGTEFSACPTASAENHAVQKVTLNVASRDARASESVAVVVRQP